MIVEATPENIDHASRLIREGKLVAFPTETVYGLGANALDPEAVARIYEAKQRPFASPLIVHVADLEMARTLTTEWPKTAQLLASRYWPGPLTLVIRKARVIPDLVTADLDSVGLRVPAHPVALALIRGARVPIAAPSANPFMAISPTTAQHVESGLGDRVSLILDGGPTRVGIESTVVSVRRHPPVVLRPGNISRSELEHVAQQTFEEEIDKPHISESPGLHHRHYAPRTPFYVLEPGTTRNGRGKVISMPKDRDAFSASLYAELRKADVEGWDWIAIEPPPNTPEWAGIRDRLKRASSDSEL